MTAGSSAPAATIEDRRLAEILVAQRRAHVLMAVTLTVAVIAVLTLMWTAIFLR